MRTTDCCNRGVNFAGNKPNSSSKGEKPNTAAWASGVSSIQPQPLMMTGLQFPNLLSTTDQFFLALRTARILYPLLIQMPGF
jgi:hypothetical protein